jgi:hypothetical protein
MRRKFVIIALAGVGLLWLLTLGLHPCWFVRAYCKGHDQYQQPEVYVVMDPSTCDWGLNFIFGGQFDVLPYPLEIAVTIDDRVEGDGVVIESLEVTFPDGEFHQVIRPEWPRGGPFGEDTALRTEEDSGRVFRRARIGIPKAVWRRDSFTMVIRGYIYGSDKQPFERKLRMDYSRDLQIITGWRLLTARA